MPPYFFRYCETNEALPFVLATGVQSLQLKIPFTFLRPTLLGNSVGELAPLAKNRNFGLYSAWTSAFTCEYASSDCVPPTIMSGFGAIAFATIGVRSVVSAG